MEETQVTTVAPQKTETLRFTKMHGIGNDFVMVDCVKGSAPTSDPAELAKSLCDRRFGVGADGLIYVETCDDPKAMYRMRMWNPDGSESEMCGNGIRCAARLLIDHGITSVSRIPIMTGAGLLVLEDVGLGLVRVDMGVARLTRGEIGMTGPSSEQFVMGEVEALGSTYKATAVSMGNPHLVIIVEDASSIDLETVGPALEHCGLFPRRTNVHFVQVLNERHIVQRTWERGAGVTLACGTGACASVVATAINGRTVRDVQVDLPGGSLKIEYAEDGHVFMTGPAETVFDGEWAS